MDVHGVAQTATIRRHWLEKVVGTCLVKTFAVALVNIENKICAVASRSFTFS